MKTLTIINQYYRPLNNPPAKRLSAFAEYIKKKGWEVNVVTGHPNYPQGKLHKGYNGIYKKELINDVNVYRFLEIPLANEGFFKRILNYLSFTVSSVFSFLIISNSDVVLISTPPVFSAISTFIIAKLFRKKVILDVRDLWPESAIEVVQVKENILFKIIRYFVNIMYKYSKLIIVISQTMKDTIVDNYKIKKNKIQVLHNFSNHKVLAGVKSNDDYINIAYTGILTEAQDILTILSESKNINNIKWHIAGSGDQLSKIQDLIITNNLDNIILYGYKDKSFCDELIEKSDIALVPLKYSKLFEMAIPSKFYEYLSFNKPILFNTSVELDSFNNIYNFGWFFNTNIAGNLESILNDMEENDISKKSINAKKLFEEKFEESIVCEKLYQLIQSL